MKRYLDLFLIYFQDALTDFGRLVAWMLLPIINGGFFLIFWFAAFQGDRPPINGWDRDSLVTYYLLLMFVSVLLSSHIEDFLEREIKLGGIAKHLLKPFSLYLSMTFFELPYRMLQGGIGILFYVIVAFIYPLARIPMPDFLSGVLILCIFISGFFISHTMKMIFGLISFWTKESKGYHDLSTVLILFFAGYNLPLTLLPDSVASIATALPFAYMLYYPVVALQGQLSEADLLLVLATSLGWVTFLGITYGIVLRRGLRVFSGVGQ